MQIINNYQPTETQRIAHSLPNRYKLFGGAMGGGKSRWLCEEAKELSMQYPGNRGVMCRYHLSDFKNSTLKTLLECLPKELIANHNQAENVIKLINGSEILYMGLAEQENISKLKSMELGWFAIDEASEIPKDNFLLFQSRLRRLLPKGGFPPFYGLLASNPDDCWLRDDFVMKGGGEDYAFIPSLPRDNPFLPKDYEIQLRKNYPEDWVKRFLEGSWDELSGGSSFIQSDWVRMAINREIVFQDKPVIGCDVARFGDDEIVIYHGKGHCLMGQDITSKKSTTETAGRIISLSTKIKSKMAAVDDAGVGGGVTDLLREAKIRTAAINGGESATDERFANLKTQLLWHAREIFESGDVSILNDPILIRQLSATKYLHRSNGKIMAEPKDEVKSRIGQSPDRADAFILMLWAASLVRDPSRDFIKQSARASIFETNESGYGWDYHHEYPVNLGAM
jgi:phage terminase large subunit